MRAAFLVLLVLVAYPLAAEHSLKGIVDLRASNLSSEVDNKSYLTGGYGKYRFNDGASAALGQLGLHYKADIAEKFAVNIVANGFSDENETSIGLTEAYIQYKGLPSRNGWRYQAKLGVFYPKISLENVATAWSTPYTITNSAINNWVGEELRHTGISFSVEKLGKFKRSPHSFTIDLSLFQNNDSTGAMLTWHGWTVGSRQTMLQETLKVQWFPARTGELSEQAAHSDPFIELDNRWGTHLVAKWQYDKKLRLNIGYYDNHAQEGLVEKGQYTWTTEFIHTGLKYKLAPKLEFITQYMSGSTLMTSPTFKHVVSSDFDSAFIMVRKNIRQHHIALRLETFNVDDLDNTVGDNNNETGKAVTLSYRYQVQKGKYLLLESNWLDSTRPARIYVGQPEHLIERQYQLAYRQYF